MAENRMLVSVMFESEIVNTSRTYKQIIHKFDVISESVVQHFERQQRVLTSSFITRREAGFAVSSNTAADKAIQINSFLNIKISDI